MLPLEEIDGVTGWRRIYVDLPWAEGSDEGGAAGTQEVADGVLAEIQELLGDEPFAVIGNSFGGMIARYIAHELRDQVLGLATLAGVAESVHSRRILPSRKVILADRNGLESAGEARADFAEMSVVQTAANLAAFVDRVLPGLRGANQTVMDGVASNYALQIEPEDAHPEPFRAPSLHIFGRQDHVVGYEDGWRLRDHYVRATYVVLDAAGHNVHLEQPVITAALVRDWLGRMAQESRLPPEREGQPG